MWNPFRKKKCKHRLVDCVNKREVTSLIEQVYWQDEDGISRYCGKYKCNICGCIFLQKLKTDAQWRFFTFKCK